MLQKNEKVLLGFRGKVSKKKEAAASFLIAILFRKNAAFVNAAWFKFLSVPRSFFLFDQFVFCFDQSVPKHLSLAVFFLGGSLKGFVNNPSDGSGYRNNRER